MRNVPQILKQKKAITKLVAPVFLADANVTRQEPRETCDMLVNMISSCLILCKKRLIYT